MADRILDDRRAALEEAFFHKENERLRAELAAKRAREAARNALASEFGVTDEALLDRLIELGIRIDTIEALMLVPLVEIAWADGKMDERERSAVLKGAAGSGLGPGMPGYELLEVWTKQRPPAELLESWRGYISALLPELSPDQRRGLEETILGRARAVAESAGGFLGLSKVSPEEEAMLDELKRAFVV